MLPKTRCSMKYSMKERVCAANLDLVRHGLVILTWGNVSEIDREAGVVAIKPSGVPYDAMKPSDMVLVDLDGKPLENGLRPSSDLATHLAIYRAFPSAGGVVHTHSSYATAWAQACRDIPNIGTTHSDHFHLAVPVTGELSPEGIDSRYEAATGDEIVATFRRRGIDPAANPAVLVAHHGPFAWGADAASAVENAVALEEVAKMASISFSISPEIRMNERLVEKHYSRKHGRDAYYGQPS